MIGCIRSAAEFHRQCTPAILRTIVALLMLGGCLLAIILPVMYVNQRVAQDEYGVFVNKFTMEVSGPYDQGAYNLIPGQEIVKFVRTYIGIDGIERMECLSSDKLKIALSIAAQYSYNMHELIPVVLYKFGKEERYKEFLSQLAIHSIMKTCANYTAESFYLNRNGIENAMTNMLSQDIEDAQLGSVLISLQMKDFDYPQRFNAAIESKQLTTQNIITQTNARQSALINAQSRLLIAKDQAQILLMYAQNNASLILNQAQNNASAIAIEWQQLQITYQTIQQSLHLDGDRFLSYLESELLRSNSGALVSLS